MGSEKSTGKMFFRAAAFSRAMRVTEHTGAISQE
jgi:hypothetical protein